MSEPLDLRAFLAHVQETAPREYLRVHRSVSPVFETAAIVAKLEAARRAPVVEFTAVEGCSWPVVTNVCASALRVARSVGLTTAELDARLRGAYDALIDPVEWSGGTPPVQECQYLGADVDLSMLPQSRYTEAETAPYLTATAVVARDPDTGAANVSYHRLMIVDRRTTAVYMAPGGHLADIVSRNGPAGTPVGVFIGAHPLWMLGALAAGPRELDELAVIGGVMESPLEVAPGITGQPVVVPARAEIALEGVIRPDRTVMEGPFGEFAGYVMPAQQRPTLDVQALTHRHEPIVQDVVAGRLEQLTLSGMTLQAYLHRKLAAMEVGFVDLYLPAPMTLFVKLDTQGNAHLPIREFLQALLVSEPYLKHVFCFDVDIDLKSVSSTQWALATRLQADRDVVVLGGLPATDMDPSETAGSTSRCGFDATAKPTLAAFAPRNRVPTDVLARVDLQALLKR